jgi:branched-chain amino acid transport system ATP-binding protein
MLELKGVRSGYRNYDVLQDIELHVPEGKIVCLLGHNGAGKSTLLKTAFGLIPVSSGRISLEGRDTHHMRAQDIVAAGMRFVPQDGNVFRGLSVEDNLRIGALRLEGDATELKKRIEEAFDFFPILGERRANLAGVLSGGERQMLAVSVALMTKPKMLLLDEPSAGLAPIIVNRLFDMIGTLRDTLNKTILLVEQNVNEALRVADSAYVMEEGHIVFHGPSSEKETIIRKLWRLDGKMPGTS